MVEVREVSGARMRRQFLNFPLKLYKGNKFFVPPLYSDEKKIFKKNYVYNDTCESVFFNAYKDGVIAGRISGILQKAANEKYGEKKVRFTRFDCIDDREVSAALFEALEKWALSRGMDTVVGPLGYSDLEREGLLIEGFDQPCTFEEQYNYEYYQHHIDAHGYEKDVDWVESQIRLPDDGGENLIKLGAYLQKKSNLHISDTKNVKEFVKKYEKDFFNMLDRSYDKIYGTVPFTEGMKKMMIDNFKLLFDTRYICLILNDLEQAIAFGILLPSMSKTMNKSQGKLYPWVLPKLLHEIKHPKVFDLGLIGVDPDYLASGAVACIMAKLVELLRESGVDHCETNLNLEDNMAIRNLWRKFNATENKRRRCYIKQLQ